jgi:hypothetical protein
LDISDIRQTGLLCSHPVLLWLSGFHEVGFISKILEDHCLLQIDKV